MKHTLPSAGQVLPNLTTTVDMDRAARPYVKRCAFDQVWAKYFDHCGCHLDGVRIARRSSLLAPGLIRRALQRGDRIHRAHWLVVSAYRPSLPAEDLRPTLMDVRAVSRLIERSGHYGLHVLDVCIRSRAGYWSARETGLFTRRGIAYIERRLACANEREADRLLVVSKH